MSRLNTDLFSRVTTLRQSFADIADTKNSINDKFQAIVTQCSQTNGDVINLKSQVENFNTKTLYLQNSLDDLKKIVTDLLDEFHQLKDVSSTSHIDFKNSLSIPVPVTEKVSIDDRIQMVMNDYNDNQILPTIEGLLESIEQLKMQYDDLSKNSVSMVKITDLRDVKENNTISSSARKIVPMLQTKLVKK